MQTPDHTLRTGIGSCRDSAWLLVSILRQLGLAARFVSGYLVQLTSDVEALDGPSGPAADFTDLHAWTEVYIPGRGVDRSRSDVGSVRRRGPHSAVGDAASGFGRSDHRSDRALRDDARLLQRRHPRARGPAGDAALHRGGVGRDQRARAPGVDERLAAGDVRLTVGGEPTFVSIDNQVDPEWTTDADGPHKRERAIGPGRTAEAGLGAGGLVQRSQGKWYPGEPLPRWQIGLYWRTDGEPLWTDEALLADPWPTEPPTAIRRGRRPTPDAQLLGAVADGLGLPASQVRPAYEDPLSRLIECGTPAGRRTRRARRRPGGRLRRAPCRAARQARRVGHRAPPPTCCRCTAATTTPAGPARDWRLRRGRIVLLEGDSPAGLRLPLDSISWRPPRASHPADPLARRDSLRADEEPDAVVDSDSEDDGRHRPPRSGRRDPGRAAARVPAAQRRAGALRRPDRAVSRPRRPRSTARW